MTNLDRSLFILGHPAPQENKLQFKLENQSQSIQPVVTTFNRQSSCDLNKATTLNHSNQPTGSTLMSFKRKFSPSIVSQTKFFPRDFFNPQPPS
jgi:hypothetical protein